MFIQARSVAVIAFVILVFTWAPHSSRGAVDLEFRPSIQTANPGDIIEIKLYAVSTGASQAMSAIEAIVAWDPAALELLGLNNNGPYTWLSSGFPNDSPQDGLNNPFTGLPANDGIAWYNALSRFPPSPPATATPSGLLVTSFRFKILNAGTTGVSMPSLYGQFTQTEVWDGVIPGLVVTRRIGGSSIILSDNSIPSVSFGGIFVMGLVIVVMGGWVLRLRRIPSDSLRSGSHGWAGITINGGRVR